MRDQRKRGKGHKIQSAARLIAESLEPRYLLSAVSWTGLGDATNWSDGANWSGGVTPTAADTVTINLPSKPTINFTGAAGTVTIQQLTCSDPLVISGGSLTISGSATSQVTAAMTISGGMLEVAGASANFTATAATTISGGTLSAQMGGQESFPAATSLTAVNMAVSSGGRLNFPAATTYSGDNLNDTTLQAAGTGGKIDLSHLQTFLGGGYSNQNGFHITHVLPTAGGEIDLAGAIGINNGGNGPLDDFTVDSTGGILGVAGITSIDSTSLTVGAGENLSFGSAATLSGVNVSVSGNGQALFPAATTYSGDNFSDTTLQVAGVGGKIDLSHLQTCLGGGYSNQNGFHITHVLPTGGGEIDLAGAIGINNGGNGPLDDFTVDSTGGILGVAGITSIDSTSLTVGAGENLSFGSAATLSGVNVSVSGNGQALFPAATTYSGDNFSDTTLQAAGTGGKIDLSHLQTFIGGGYSNQNGFHITHVLPTGGGEIDLAGAIGINNGGNGPLDDFTVDSTGGILGVAGISSIDSTSLTIGAGQNLSFGSVTTLSGVNVSVSGNGQALFPAATTYSGDNFSDTTLQVAGVGGKIDLSHLQTCLGGGYSNQNGFHITHVLPTGGGEIDLAGAIGINNGGNGPLDDFTVDSTGGILGVAGITSIDSTSLTVGAGENLSFGSAATLSGVNVSVSGNGQVLFPAATTYSGDNFSDTTLQVAGVGGKIDLSHLQTFLGGGYSNQNGFHITHVLPTGGGEIELAGAIGINNGGNGPIDDFTVDSTGGILGVAGITSIDSTSFTVGAGVNLSFGSVTTLSGVNVSVSGNGQVLFPVATTYSGDNFSDTTLQAAGSEGKIDLSHLQTFVGGGYSNQNGSHSTHLLPSNGGEIDIGGAISSNGQSNDVTLNGGVLTIDGDGTIASTDTINIGIGVGGAGQLNIVGMATLGGTLNITVLNGYLPPVGKSYNIVSYGSATGTFAAIDGLLETGVGFTSSMSPTGITLLTTLGLGTTPATATLVSTNPTVAPGNSVTFTTTFAAPSATAPTPSGAATFFDGTTQIGMATLDTTGAASLTTSALSAGTHTITVSYSGDTNYAAGVSSPIIETVSAPVVFPPPVTIGELDPTFGTNGRVAHEVGLSGVSDVAIQGDGKSVIAGSSGTAGAQDIAVTRYNVDGSLDTAFGVNGVVTTNVGGDDVASAELLLANGDILVAGTSTAISNGQPAGSQFVLVEYTPAGALDTSFGGGAGYVLTSFSTAAGTLSNDIAHCLAVAPSGEIFVGGSSDAAGAGQDFAIAAYNADGSLATSFGGTGRVTLDFTGGNDSIESVALQGDGGLVAAGSTAGPSSAAGAVALARFLPSGTLDAKFGNKGKVTTSVGGVDDAGSSVAIGAKGTIVVGGSSATGSAAAGTLSDDFLVLRYLSNGKLDHSFGNNGSVVTSFNQPAAVTRVLVDSDGTIVASGKTTDNLATLDPSLLDAAIARYSANGQPDPTFNGNGRAVFSFAITPGASALTSIGGHHEQPAIVPLDAASDLMQGFMQLVQSDQGVIAMTQNGELLDAGNNGTQTIEAKVIAMGLDLALTLISNFPSAVLTGAKGMITVQVDEMGTEPAAGTDMIELFASSSSQLPAGQSAFQSFPAKIKLKRGQKSTFKLKFAYPSSIADGSYFILANIDVGSVRDLDLRNNFAASADAVDIAKPFVKLSGTGLAAPAFNGSKPAAVTFTVANNGNIAAGNASAVQFLASTDGTLANAISIATIPIKFGLKPGDSRSMHEKVSLKVALPANTYYLLAVLDPNDVFGGAGANLLVSTNTFVVG